MEVQRSKSTGLPLVHIDVPAGQLEVGRELLRCMYEQQPKLCDMGVHTMLQLLLLADKYDVPAVMAAVGSAFSSKSVEQLPWDAVTAVHSLPAGYAENAGMVAVYAAACDKLQHELGDLELVFADSEGQQQQQFRSLPHAAMLQLLRDERTRVASENTAAHAVLAWTQAQNDGLGDNELLQLVSCGAAMARCGNELIACMCGEDRACICVSDSKVSVLSFSSTCSLLHLHC
jgi:hypothetical protein